MCDPLTIFSVITGALGLASTLGSKDTKPPPLPAAAPDPAKSPDAKIKNGAADNATDPTASSNGTVISTARKSGTALGNLGRSGLQL